MGSGNFVGDESAGFSHLHAVNSVRLFALPRPPAIQGIGLRVGLKAPLNSVGIGREQGDRRVDLPASEPCIGERGPSRESRAFGLHGRVDPRKGRDVSRIESEGGEEENQAKDYNENNGRDDCPSLGRGGWHAERCRHVRPLRACAEFNRMERVG